MCFHGARARRRVAFPLTHSVDLPLTCSVSCGDSVKAWTAEIWIGVFIVICALISFFILAAMANSADCGCSCAAR
eukprot:2869207-Rhodomonas_salina.1